MKISDISLLSNLIVKKKKIGTPRLCEDPTKFLSIHKNSQKLYPAVRIYLINLCKFINYTV